MTQTQRTNLQYLAFKSIWQQLFRLNCYERFCIAIGSTSDEAMDEALRRRPEKVKEWLKNYSKYTSVLD